MCCIYIYELYVVLSVYLHINVTHFPSTLYPSTLTRAQSKDVISYQYSQLLYVHADGMFSRYT